MRVPLAFVIAASLIVVAGCGEPSIPAVASPFASPPPPPPPPGAGDFANRQFPSPLSVADAEQILLRTRVFAFGSSTSRRVQAYNVVFDQPDARARFASIAAHAETAGKLYALCGLIALDDDAWTALATNLARAPDTLQVWDSDVGGVETPATAVALISDHQLWAVLRQEKRATERYFSASQSKPADEATAAIAAYRSAVAAASHQARGLESALAALASMRDALIAHVTHDKTVLEAMSNDAFLRLRRNLPGVILGRRDTVFVNVVADIDYFAKLARAGDAADRAFWAAQKATHSAFVWPVYVEQTSDYNGCTRFGAMDLVDAYRAWSDFRRTFPDRYRDEAIAALGGVANQLTQSTCACGDAASVERELGRFVQDFPASDIRAPVERRLRALQAGKSDIHPHCK